MRRQYNIGYTALHRNLSHQKGFLLGGRAVIHAGQHVAMQVDHTTSFRSMAWMAALLTSSGVRKVGTRVRRHDTTR